jgi:ABC-type Fe3+-hydroxamate transport system substrate-binding protein
MLNPYTINPRKIETVEQAKSALKPFDANLVTQAATTQKTEEMLGATMDVLVQKYPDLAQSLDQLAYSGKLVGHSEQAAQDTALMRQQFVSALPYAIKIQL